MSSELSTAWEAWIASPEHAWQSEETYHRACFNAGFKAGRTLAADLHDFLYGLTQRSVSDVSERASRLLDEHFSVEPPDTPYVIDCDHVVWRVVRDGGMATRADANGIESIGIVALERTRGPLRGFNPTAWLEGDLHG